MVGGWTAAVLAGAACSVWLSAAAAQSVASAVETPAKQLFGSVPTPNAGAAKAIGGYARGCLAGGRTLQASGPGWQVMRLSRNRNHGHPELIAFVERLAGRVREIGWPGLLVGDMAQPIGGPMLTGHASHQIGLDVDIWMRPAPDRTLSSEEREAIGSYNMVAADGRATSAAWTGDHIQVLKAAASDAAVARIFVNAAIKRAVCDAVGDGPSEADWLRKLRPWWGHDHHFHVRLECPAGSPDCRDQPAPPPGTGCDASLDWWFSAEARAPRSRAVKGPLTLADLPVACRRLVDGG
ncbi:MAG: penicillin-insensitive murein endopeptidase [Pseudomonadota bacterium]